jgi:CelD/BcsL family acetyltransferase involved in cellulose biosynthesis
VNRDMRVTVFTTLPDDARFGEEWDRLVQAMESPQVFYTYEWAVAVSRAYSSPAPLLLAAYRESSLVGIAALALDHDRGEASFLCGSTADYCDFVSAPADREELIALVMRELHARGITTLRFANLPSDSVSAGVLRKVARASGYSMFERPAYFCARIALDSPEQRLQITQSARRSLKKARNVAARMGGAAVAHRKSYEEFMAEFPEYAAANVARFVGTGQTSNLLTQKRRVFMAELAKLLAAKGWLTFSTLALNGRSVAWHFGFQFAGTWFSYLPAFDGDLSNLHPGPGAYLLYEILQQASQDPETRVVDLGLGDEGYKQPYAKAGRRTLYIVASRSNLRVFREMSRHRLGQVLKRSPKLEGSVRTCIARIAAARRSVAQHGVARFALSSSRTLWNRIFQSAEFIFLESARQEMKDEMEFKLGPLSMKLLAGAAIKYENDPETLEYVQRFAARLRRGGNKAFALLDAEDSPVHICWVAPFDGFQVPGLKHTLAEPAPHSAMLFDPWTCSPQRSRSAQFTAIIAAQTLQHGQKPWICTDRQHLALFESAGFVPRFSLVKKRKLFLSGNSTLEFRDDTPQLMGLHPAA